MWRTWIVAGFVAFAAIAAVTGHLLLVGYVLAALTLAVIVGLMAWGVVGVLSWRIEYRRRVLGRTGTGAVARDDRAARRAA